MAFDSPDKLLLGLLTGIIFGVLLQKGRVAKLDVIVGWPQWTGTSPWPWVAGLVAVIAGGLVLLHNVRQTTPGGHRPASGDRDALAGRRTVSVRDGAGHVVSGRL